jgi:hypothetical protein
MKLFRPKFTDKTLEFVIMNLGTWL